MLRSQPGPHVGFDDRVAVVANIIYEYDVPPEERVCYRDERIAAIGPSAPGTRAIGDRNPPATNSHGAAQVASGAPGEGQTY